MCSLSKVRDYGATTLASETISGFVLSIVGINANRRNFRAAAIHLTKSLSITLGSRKVTVNGMLNFPFQCSVAFLTKLRRSAICPGIYPSAMTKRGFEKEADNINDIHPMGRPGTPEDVSFISR